MQRDIKRKGARKKERKTRNGSQKERKRGRQKVGTCERG